MRLAKLQIETLIREFPPDVDDGWDVDLENIDVQRLVVRQERLTPHRDWYASVDAWERYITEDGVIWRYDDDTESYVLATAEPLEGSYTARGKTRRFWY